MDRAVVAHVRPWYADQAASDAARLAALRHAVLGEPAPTPPPPTRGRVTFAQLRRASAVDPVAFRAVVRIMGMVGDAETLYTDPAVVAATHAALDRPMAAAPGPRALSSKLRSRYDPVTGAPVTGSGDGDGLRGALTPSEPKQPIDVVLVVAASRIVGRGRRGLVHPR
jgi:hypothetical protein